MSRSLPVLSSERMATFTWLGKLSPHTDINDATDPLNWSGPAPLPQDGDTIIVNAGSAGNAVALDLVGQPGTPDPGSSARQTLAVGVGGDVADGSGLVARQLEDLTQDVGEPMVAVQALQHPEGAAELDLLGQNALVGFGVSGRIEAVLEISGEGGKRPGRLFHPSPPGGKEVVRRHPIDPGAEGGFSSKAVQARHDLDEDLLAGVLGVLGMPQNPQGQPVDVVADPDHEVIERLPVTGTGPLGELLDRHLPVLAAHTYPPITIT